MEIIRTNQFAPLISLVVDSVDSENSKYMYRRLCHQFLDWWTRSDKPPFTKATVNQYKTELLACGYSPSTVNFSLSVVKKLANEASDNGLLDFQTATAISKIKGIKRSGKEIGRWLSEEQSISLLNLPDKSLIGLRDRALLGVLLGCGLRRSEVANLQLSNIQFLENRHVLTITGKGNKTRNIIMPEWVYKRISDWCKAGKIEDKIFISVKKGGKVGNRPLWPGNVMVIVKNYGKQLGLNLSPHDLRRTFARLALNNGASLYELSKVLGHSSVAVTELYVGMFLNFQSPVCDFISNPDEAQNSLE
jgi:site-specific recombinase XerD